MLIDNMKYFYQVFLYKLGFLRILDLEWEKIFFKGLIVGYFKINKFSMSSTIILFTTKILFKLMKIIKLSYFNFFLGLMQIKFVIKDMCLA